MGLQIYFVPKYFFKELTKYVFAYLSAAEKKSLGVGWGGEGTDVMLAPQVIVNTYVVNLLKYCVYFFPSWSSMI